MEADASAKEMEDVPSDADVENLFVTENTGNAVEISILSSKECMQEHLYLTVHQKIDLCTLIFDIEDIISFCLPALMPKHGFNYVLEIVKLRRRPATDDMTGRL